MKPLFRFWLLEINMIMCEKRETYMKPYLGKENTKPQREHHHKPRQDYVSKSNDAVTTPWIKHPWNFEKHRYPILPTPITTSHLYKSMSENLNAVGSGHKSNSYGMAYFSPSSSQKWDSILNLIMDNIYYALLSLYHVLIHLYGLSLMKAGLI